jgi:hypothetical protein
MFMDAVLSWHSDDKTVRLPATRIQPMASADVAQAAAEVCVRAPLRGTRNVAGPEVFTLDELGRITLAAHGDQRTVVTDTNAGIFAAAASDILIAKGDAVGTSWARGAVLPATRIRSSTNPTPSNRRNINSGYRGTSPARQPGNPGHNDGTPVTCRGPPSVIP